MAGRNVRRKKANKKTMILVVVLAAVLSFVMIIGIVRLKIRNDALQVNREALEANVSSAAEEGSSLEEEKDKGLTESDIIRIAREKFGLLFDNEILFVPEESE